MVRNHSARQRYVPYSNYLRKKNGEYLHDFFLVQSIIEPKMELADWPVKFRREKNHETNKKETRNLRADVENLWCEQFRFKDLNLH